MPLVVPGSPSGRQAEAARNDDIILDAARMVFLAHPSAPIADVAKEAGVGISVLYRRCPSKEGLLRELARDGLTRYRARRWRSESPARSRLPSHSGGSPPRRASLRSHFTVAHRRLALCATTSPLPTSC